MLTACAIPTTRLDLMSPELAADPWPPLRQLRGQGPIVWHEHYRRWFVTSDRDVRAILSDFRHFTVEDTSSSELFGADAFISIDDRARHDALRLVWAEAFRTQGLQPLRAQVEAIAARLLDPVVECLRSGATVEAVGSLCRPLPTLVICLMMGVPSEMLPDVVRWSDAMAGGGPAYLAPDQVAAAVERREAAKAALADYLGELLARRRAALGSDLVSVLACSAAAQPLSDAQLVQNLRQLLFAGNETTAKWLAHILVTYGEDQKLQRALRGDRTLVGPANDEVLRWQGVVGTLVRRVRSGPVVVADVELADGDGVTCLLACANRDPDRYERPDVFDHHRLAQPNLGFGLGLHHCLGINLARLEAEILVNRLLDRIPAFRIAAPHAYSPLPLRGPRSVTLAI